MLTDNDRLTILVYHDGLGVDLGTLLGEQYPRYADNMQRLVAARGDAADVIGADTNPLDRSLITRAGALVRLIQRVAPQPLENDA